MSISPPLFARLALWCRVFKSKLFIITLHCPLTARQSYIKVKAITNYSIRNKLISSSKFHKFWRIQVCFRLHSSCFLTFIFINFLASMNTWMDIGMVGSGIDGDGVGESNLEKKTFYHHHHHFFGIPIKYLTSATLAGMRRNRIVTKNNC